MPLERHYSIATLANLFDLSADFWRKKIKSGEIKAIKLGTAVRIPEGEIRKLAQNVRSISDTVEELLSEFR